MKIEPVEISAAYTLPFAWIRTYGEVRLGSAPESLCAEELNELIEARFFNDKEEIRIFYKDDTLCATRLAEELEDKYVSSEYILENPKFGSSITVYHCLDTDDDGQTYVRALRLAGWKGV